MTFESVFFLSAKCINLNIYRMAIFPSFAKISSA